MLRWLTAGESHGPALVAVLEGLPAGVAITTAEIGTALARRRLGYGRGARMAFEQDEVELLGGVRHGRTLGGPVADPDRQHRVAQVGAGDERRPGRPEAELAELARNAPLTRPRPGHADLVGMQKYGFDDARPVLERASARETAARVALGAVAAAFLDQASASGWSSHTCVGSARRPSPTGAAARPGRRGRARRRPGAVPRPGRLGPRWSPRSTRPSATATPSAASSRCWPTACRPASAATCTGTAGSTRGWPAR